MYIKDLLIWGDLFFLVNYTVRLAACYACLRINHSLRMTPCQVLYLPTLMNCLCYANKDLSGTCNQSICIITLGTKPFFPERYQLLKFVHLPVATLLIVIAKGGIQMKLTWCKMQEPRSGKTPLQLPFESKHCSSQCISNYCTSLEGWNADDRYHFKIALALLNFFKTALDCAMAVLSIGFSLKFKLNYKENLKHVFKSRTLLWSFTDVNKRGGKPLWHCLR